MVASGFRRTSVPEAGRWKPDYNVAMSAGRIALALLVAILVTLGLGYVWGSSGRIPAERARDAAQQQLDLAEARGELLEARVSLYNVNFGDAARHFEQAKAPLQRVEERYRTEGKEDAATEIAAAIERASDGQKLAAKLDQGANSRANDALEAIKRATQK
jgi:hypothetical protein